MSEGLQQISSADGSRERIPHGKKERREGGGGETGEVDERLAT
jgi:hypothetical protein